MNINSRSSMMNKQIIEKVMRQYSAIPFDWGRFFEDLQEELSAFEEADEFRMAGTLNCPYDLNRLEFNMLTGGIRIKALLPNSDHEYYHAFCPKCKRYYHVRAS